MVPPKQQYKDDWGTSAREGYEDRGAFRPPRAPQKQSGSSVLRTIGILCMAGGFFWLTYVATRGTDIVGALEQNHGPLLLVGLGVVVSFVGKYLRI